MDTEFPGEVAQPIGTFRSRKDKYYQTLRCNVDLLNIIQLGVTLFDEANNGPSRGACTWQFNFRFTMEEEMFAVSSIDLLKNAGIDFQLLSKDGIDVADFGYYLITSGLVFNDSVKWISFQGGYDFTYLLKVMMCEPLPAKEVDYFHLVQTYFPCLYDVRFLSMSCKSLSGGLSDIAKQLGIPRLGTQHQAGSDSYVTGMIFFHLLYLHFDGCLDTNKYQGVLHSLNNPPKREVPNRAHLL